MKIILISIGTRGDIEPFLAMGQILKSKGHEVIAAFPEQFRNLAEETGLEFASLGSEFIEMLDSREGRIVMGGGGSFWNKIKAYIKLVRNQNSINKALVTKQFEIVSKENPDRIVHNGKAIYPVIWSLKNKGKTTLASPVPYIHYVKNHTHVAFHSNWGPFLNKLTYKLANFGLIKTVMISIKWLPITKRLQQKEIQKALLTNNAIYTVSPTLFERPNYWPENIKVLGYQEREKIVEWIPDSKLVNFLETHEKVLLVTFGSMINPRAIKITRILQEILEESGIPAIINTASGGLVEPDHYNHSLLYFVSQIPYDWAFPKIYGVIHHGGSGTTHTALKYGCASLIIPHIIDQFVWNEINYKIGAGPLGIKLGKLTKRKLTPKIKELVNLSRYKKKAEELGRIISNEDFIEDIHRAITH